MDTLITFITILAWAGFVLGGLIWFFCGWMNHRYNKPGTQENLQRVIDQMHGVKRHWPPGRWFILTLVSAAWLIATCAYMYAANLS